MMMWSLKWADGTWCILGAVILLVMSIGLRAGRSQRGRIPLVRCFEWMILIGFLMLLINGIAEIWRPSLSKPFFLVLKWIVYLLVFVLQAVSSVYISLLIRFRSGGKARVNPVYSILIITGCLLGAVDWSITTFQPVYYDVWKDQFIFGIPLLITTLNSMIVFVLNWWVLFVHRKDLGRNSTVILSMFLAAVAYSFVGEYYFSVPPMFFQAILFSLVGAFVMMQRYQEDAMIRAAAAREKERLLVVTERMKPHFLYNCLTTIYMLCDRDTRQAQDALAVFTSFLRDTMDTLESQDTVPIKWELRQVENYMYLEKMRFGDRLDIQYRIGIRNFQIPLLSVQPLVENAVKYGSGGENTKISILVETLEQDGEILVRVSDDGCGFLPENVPGDGREHLGLETVRERIQLICQGSLTVESRPGEGTVVEIHLPRENTEPVKPEIKSGRYFM